MQARGVFPILPTPFTDRGAIDEVSLRRLIDYELEVGVHGLSILGFMGEAHKLALEGRRRVIATAVDQAAGHIPVWAGVRALGSAGAIEQAREAQELGAAAVFVAPVGVQNDDVLFDFYGAVDEAIEISVVIHDFPDSFLTILSPELVARIARQIDGVRYIKLEEQPVLVKLSRILSLAGGHIGIFGGLGGEYFLEELERGSRGIMTGFAFPEVLVAVYRAFRKARARSRGTGFRPGTFRLSGMSFSPGSDWLSGSICSVAAGSSTVPSYARPGMSLDERTRAELEDIVGRVGLSSVKGGVQIV